VKSELASISDKTLADTEGIRPVTELGGKEASIVPWISICVVLPRSIGCVIVSGSAKTGGPVPVTVTALVAVRTPSTVLTVIVAAPDLTPVTKPVALTVATEVLLELHVTLLSEAFSGTTVAVNCCDVPACIVAETGVKVTPVTDTAVTLTVLVAVRTPSTVLTVMLAVPALIPAINPVGLTMATELSLDAHKRSLLEALAGAIVAFS